MSKYLTECFIKYPFGFFLNHNPPTIFLSKTDELGWTGTNLGDELSKVKFSLYILHLNE